MTNKKTYILDTNVLIDDPMLLTHLKDRGFENCNIVLPVTVLDELDKLKKQPGEVGKKARLAVRALDKLSDEGLIHEGIELEGDNTLTVDIVSYDTKPFGDPLYGDVRIIALANHYTNVLKMNCTLLTNDVNMRVRAKAHKILCTGYNKASAEGNHIETYAGYRTITDGLMLEKLVNEGFVDPRNFDIHDLHPNEGVVFKDAIGDTQAIARLYDTDSLELVKKKMCFGISAKNSEQELSMNLILDKLVPLVTLSGMPGTGKSLVAIASALELVIERGEYQKLIIYRPMNVIAGQDIGFLPGPQPLDAKVLTPDGWSTMGEMKVGSEVISRDGKATKVIGVFPKGKKAVYKVTTTDGGTVECCEDHLWETKTWEQKKRGKPGKVKSTKEIMETMKTSKGKINHYLPRNETVEYNKQANLPVPAYLMGALLGDGSISNNICLTNVDLDIVEKVSEQVKQFNCHMTHNDKTITYNIVSNDACSTKTTRKVKITNLIDNSVKIYDSIGLAHKDFGIKINTLKSRCQTGATINNVKYEFMVSHKTWQNPIKEELHKLGLIGKHAQDKFIPQMYKTASVSDRIDLIRGLMDTDGTIKKNGEASFTTTSLQLANDIVEITKSLGGKANIKSRNRINKVAKLSNGRLITSRRISYEFNICLPETINPFHCERKSKHHKCTYMHYNGISSIELVGEKEVQCIRVENPEHLYITNDFTVTHNTMEEKIEQNFGAILDSFEVLLSKKTKRSGKGGAPVSNRWKEELKSWQEKGIIEFNPITFVRGRSISNAILLIDECQNLSKEDAKTLLTRVGENTKIIMTGDLEQIDTQNLDATNNALIHVLDHFKESKLAGHVTLIEGQRSALAKEAALYL